MFISDAPSLIALNGGAYLRDSAVRLQHYIDVNPGNKAGALAFWQNQKALAAVASGHPADGLFIGPGVRDIRTDCYKVLSAVRMGVAADKVLYEQFCDFFIGANTTAGPLVLDTDLAPAKAVITGNQLSLSVAVSGGVGPYTYAWTKDGAPVGTNAATYAVTPVVAGVYACTVTDTIGGSVESTACTVTLIPTLVFTKNVTGSNASDAAAAYVALGASYTNNVTVSGGSGNYTYQWFKTSGGVDSPVGTNSNTLTVATYAAGNNGDYWCRVTDTNSTVITSNKARTKVAVRLTTNTPAEAEWTEGSPGVLSVVAADGLAPLTYQWYKDGVAVPGASTSATLTVSNTVTTDAAGIYSCIVTSSNTNAPKTVESVRCTVTVIALP